MCHTHLLEISLKKYFVYWQLDNGFKMGITLTYSESSLNR